jgi:nucleotide-binding universal stress UspA family protein
LRLSVQLAGRIDGRLVVLFVNDPLLLAVAAATFHRRPQFLERTRDELERSVAESVGPRTARSRDIVCRVAQGDAAGEILNAAGRENAALIVMGTHGLGGIEKLLLGSTTERVLRRAVVPVLAIPPKKVTGIRRVIVPIDPDGAWAYPLKGAADVARWFDADLVIVHVVRQPALPPWLRASKRVERARLARARRVVEQAGARVPAGIKARTVVLTGDPASQIAAYAGSGPPSLIVMTLRSEGAARRGSTTDRVLAHGVAPVLALPRPA